jgi:hypothetical protein
MKTYSFLVAIIVIMLLLSLTIGSFLSADPAQVQITNTPRLKPTKTPTLRGKPMREWSDDFVILKES